MAQTSFTNVTVTDGTHHISDTSVYGTWNKSISDGELANFATGLLFLLLRLLLCGLLAILYSPPTHP